MKILKNYLALIVCFVMLVPGMSVKAETTSGAPMDKKWDITIATGSDIKGCYYDDNGDTDISNNVWKEDEECFPDATLGNKVFDALVKFYSDEENEIEGYPFKVEVVNGVIKSKEDTTMRDVLYDFRGDIDAKYKTGETKIESIKGVQFLIHAKTIDLTKQGIANLTDLNVSGNRTLFAGNHYGYGNDPENPGISRNVVWKLAGNPFQKLPYSLGGRLVIEAPQTKSSQYPDTEQTKFRFKRDNTETFSGQLSINKCIIMDFNEDGTPKLDGNGQPLFRDVHISSINFVKTAITDVGDIEDVADMGIHLDTTQGTDNKGFTDTTLYFTGLQTSRRQKIGIGADQEINYVTSDEYDLGTGGKQSFKYYLDPYFYVYDTISVAAEEYKPVKLKKVDSDTQVGLAGAEFQVYDANGAPVGDVHISDVNGDVLIEHLPVGNYTVKEIKAPSGYEKSNETKTFEITKDSVNGLLTITGGTQSFEETDNKGIASGTTHTAEAKTTFIAGPLNDPIVLTKEGNDELKSIAVTYSRVSTDGTTIEDNVKETFDSVEEATVKINERKSLGHIYGSVSVMGYFEGLAEQAISLGTFENTKTPPTTPDEPGTPGRPGKPTEPTEPEEPLIPLVPAEPIEPETPTTPEVPTVPVTPTSPKVPNTSTESLKDVWGVLMGLSFIAIVGIVIKARKEN